MYYYLQLLLNLTNRQVTRASIGSGQRREKKTSRNERKAHVARGHESQSHCGEDNPSEPLKGTTSNKQPAQEPLIAAVGPLGLTLSDPGANMPRLGPQAEMQTQKVLITLILIIPRFLKTSSTTTVARMGKILQKKKARSSVSKAKAKNNRLKSGNKKINVLGNAIIAQNWYAIRKKKIPKANALTSPPI